MAADYVVVDRSKQPGNQLVRLASLLTEARSICRQVVNVGMHTIDGTDYSLLETVFGIPTGQGDDITTMVTAINNILNNTTTVAGTDRLAALDEFTGRVGLQ